MSLIISLISCLFLLTTTTAATAETSPVSKEWEAKLSAIIPHYEEFRQFLTPVTHHRPTIYLLTDAEKAEIRKKYTVTDRASMIRHAVPRFYGSSEFAPSLDYAIGIATLVAPGIFFAVLTILWCILFCCCRNVCNLCGGKNPKPEGYTKRERWCPYFTLIVFTATIVSFTIVGLVFSTDLSHRIVGSTTSVGLGGYSSDADSDFGGSDSMIGTLFTVVNYANDLTTTLDDILTDFLADFNDIYNEVLDKISNANEILPPGVSNIVTSLRNFGDSISGTTIDITPRPGAPNEVSAHSFPCGDFCVNIGDQINDVCDNINDAATPAFRSMNDTVNQLRSSFIDVQDQIQEQADNAREQIHNGREKINDFHDLMTSAADTVKYYDDKRKPVVIVFFVLPLLAGLFVVLGGFIHKPFVLRVTYIYFFFILFLMWLLFAIHLPLAVLTGDSCDYVGDFEVDVTDKFGDDAGKVIQSCLLNTSLLDVYNLSDELSFRDKIPFYELPSIDSIFNFTVLDDLTNDVNNLGLGDFDFGGLNADSDLSQINNITQSAGDTTVYNRSNIADFNESLFTPQSVAHQLAVLKYETLLVVDAEAAMRQKLSYIKSNMTAINRAVSKLKNDTNVILDGVNDLRTVLDPLFGYVDRLKALATCGFLGSAYLNFKKAYCDGVVTALSCMAMATFFIGLFGVPFIILSIVLKKRLPFPFAADPFSPSVSKKGRFSGGEANDIPMQQTTNATYGNTTFNPRN